MDTPRASPLSSSVRPLVSQSAGCPACTPANASSTSRRVVTTGMLLRCLVIIVWSVSYVLGVERAGGGDLIGTADNRARILEHREFEWSGFEAQQIFVELHVPCGTESFRKRREVDAGWLRRRDLNRVTAAEHGGSV